MKVWILTTEYNEYDQYGEYFVAVFKNKPAKTHLEEVLSNGKCVVLDTLLNHILEGGGRLTFEHQWWFLREVECR